MQKWYVVDFLNHKIVKNDGALPQYFVEDHHEPIVPKEVFYQAQGEMQRRSLLKYDPGKIRFGSQDVLKGRLVCGICGRILKRYINPDPSKTDWRCRKRAYEKQSLTKEVEARCPCRNCPENEVKKAIVDAFNALPWKRDELVRLQGGIWNGEIKRIDEQIEGVQEQQKRLNARLDNVVLDEEEEGGGEAGFLRGELETLEMEYTRLVLERAEAANKEVQIRILLELVEAMRREAGAHLSFKHESSDDQPESGGACYDYDEFFRRTSYVVDSEVIGDDGKIMCFSNDLIIRYLEKVVVNPDGYEVFFKAGVGVSIPVGKLKK